MKNSTKIIKVPPQKLPEASRVLSRAFQNDPLLSFVLPNAQRRKQLSKWFDIAINFGKMYGEVYSTDNIEGTSIWIKPGYATLNPMRLIRTGIYKAPLIFGIYPFIRLIKSLSFQEKRHKQDVSPHHWYLLLLGVDPTYQRQGIGGALLQPILTRADEQGIQCYLETTTESNLHFYNKHGFQIITTTKIPKGGPPCWTMRREPKTATPYPDTESSLTNSSEGAILSETPETAGRP